MGVHVQVHRSHWWNRKVTSTIQEKCNRLKSLSALLFLTTSELHEVCFWGSHGLRWCWVMESGEVVAFSREHLLWQQSWMKDRLDCCKYLWGNVIELMSWTWRNAFEWSGTSSSGASTHADLVGFYLQLKDLWYSGMIWRFGAVVKWCFVMETRGYTTLFYACICSWMKIHENHMYITWDILWKTAVCCIL